MTLSYENLPKQYEIYKDYRTEILNLEKNSKVEIVDIYRYFEKFKSKISEYTKKYLRNPNHVNEIGNALMAYIFCKELGLPQTEFPDWIEIRLTEEKNMFEQLLTTSSSL